MQNSVSLRKRDGKPVLPPQHRLTQSGCFFFFHDFVQFRYDSPHNQAGNCRCDTDFTKHISVDTESLKRIGHTFWWCGKGRNVIAPATPCSATLIGAQTMEIDGQLLPIRASMGMLTQPISFLGLPVVTVPLRTANGQPIGLQLIAAPFNEQACLRAARALEEMGITDARPVEIAA